MCGRFQFFTDQDNTAVTRYIQDYIPNTTGLDKYDTKRGDVFPSQIYPVIIEGQTHPEAVDMTWGYQLRNRSDLLINARSETADELRTFKDDFKDRRCIIPATGFYEWTKKKDRYLFENERGILFMGGLYTKPRYNQSRFVILTKHPDDVVDKIHNRMPVLIPPELSMDWLKSPEISEEIYNDYSVNLSGFKG